ncbi:MAG: hypothetical protein RJA49_2500 [Actinomycetota bacterium]
MTSRRRAAGILILFASVSGCSVVKHTASGGPTGVVQGDVLAGPTCPVQTTDAAACAPAPVAGSVEFWQGDTSTGEVSIREDGSFSVNVPVGTYTVKVVVTATNGFPVCKDSTLTVNADTTQQLHIECDTGIR